MKIRKATLHDIAPIHGLLKNYGSSGVLLSRALSELYDHLRDFHVQTDPDGRVIACCALQFCWEDLAEVRSLAVHPNYLGRGIGASLVNAVVEEARAFGIKRLFTLTYRPDFFQKMGFHLIDRAELPLKIWSDCIRCVKFPNCDENAMMRKIQ